MECRHESGGPPPDARLNEVSTFLQMRIVRQIFTAHRGEGCNARALQELRNFPTVAL